MTHSCIDIPSALYDVLKAADSLVAYDYVRTMLGINAGECIDDLHHWLRNNATAYVPLLENELININKFLDDSMGKQHLTGAKLISKVDYEPLVNAPITRAGAVYTGK